MKYLFSLIKVMFMIIVTGVLPLSCFGQDACWVRLAEMPFDRAGHSACVLDGKMYILGGMYALPGAAVNTVKAYDPEQDAWTEIAPMNIKRNRFQACICNGKIYAFGGSKDAYGTSAGSILESFEVYDPLTESWTDKGLIPKLRFDGTASVVNGKIYLIGGAFNSFYSPVQQVDIYDPEADTWSIGKSMPTPRSELASAVLNGKIFLFGGIRGMLNGENGERTVEMYDPETDTWTKKAYMINGRKLMPACALNGLIYVLGGAKGYCVNDLTSVEVYDPEKDSWTEVSDTPEKLAAHAGTVIDGNIYVSGGCLYCTGGTESAMYKYSPCHETLALIEDFRVNKSYVQAGSDSLLLIGLMNDSANVTLTVVIESPDNISVDSLQLYDDGMHNDGSAGDHLYANVWVVNSSEERHYFTDLLVSEPGGDPAGSHLNNLATFTSVGPVSFDHYSYASSDTIPNPGDEVKINLWLKNYGLATSATNLNAIPACEDSSVTLIYNEYIPDIFSQDLAAGQCAKLNQQYTVRIPEEYEPGSRVKLNINISSEGINFWSDSLSIEVAELGTAVNHSKEGRISIHPNPAKDRIYLETANSVNFLYKILNMSGQVISQGEYYGGKYLFDISDYPQGIYILTLVSGSNFETLRFIKQ